MTYMVGKPTKNDLEMVSLPPIFVQRPQAVRDSRTLMVVGFSINIPQMLLGYIPAPWILWVMVIVGDGGTGISTARHIGGQAARDRLKTARLRSIESPDDRWL